MKTETLLALFILAVSGCSERHEATIASVPSDPLLEYAKMNDALSRVIGDGSSEMQIRDLVRRRDALSTELMLVEVLMQSTNLHADVVISEASRHLFETNMPPAQLVQRREALRLALATLEEAEYKWRSAFLKNMMRTRRSRQRDAEPAPRPVPSKAAADGGL